MNWHDMYYDPVFWIFGTIGIIFFALMKGIDLYFWWQDRKRDNNDDGQP